MMSAVSKHTKRDGDNNFMCVCVCVGRLVFNNSVKLVFVVFS